MVDGLEIHCSGCVRNAAPVDESCRPHDVNRGSLLEHVQVLSSSSGVMKSWLSVPLNELADFHGSTALFSALICGEDYFKRLQRFVKASKWHGLTGIQGIEEGLKLALIRMVTHVPGIEHLHGQLAPRVLVSVQLHGMEFIIEQAALASAEMSVEVVGLEAVHNGGGFADRAVFETDDGCAARVIFVGLENLAAAAGRKRGDALHFAAHDHEQGIERVTSGGQESATPVFFASIPAKLAIPRTDAVVVIDLTVVETAKQAFVNESLGDLELVGETALKAYAALYAIALGGRGNFTHFLKTVCHWFFKDDVLLRIRSGHCLVAVLAGVAGDIHDMDGRIGQHGFQVLVALDLATMLGTEFGIVELTGRVDGCDLALRGFVDCFDVGGGRPAVSDDADVVFFHGGEECIPAAGRKGVNLIPSERGGCFKDWHKVSIRAKRRFECGLPSPSCF